MASVLKPACTIVGTARDGPQAIDAARALGPDVIVLDRDPTTVPVDDIRRIKVDLVFALGQQVWSRN